MWERFMTKPLVDKGILRRIADCPTPWPCFVIAVREDFLKKYPNAISQILEIINLTTREFKEIPSIDKTLASKYHQKTEDIQEWLRLTEWSQKSLTENMLNKIQNQLFELKIIDKIGTFASIVKAV
jgi:DNA-binding ferritin-like protein (Dps family)